MAEVLNILAIATGDKAGTNKKVLKKLLGKTDIEDALRSQEIGQINAGGSLDGNHTTPKVHPQRR